MHRVTGTGSTVLTWCAAQQHACTMFKALVKKSFSKFLKKEVTSRNRTLPVHTKTHVQKMQKYVGMTMPKSIQTRCRDPKIHL